MSEVHTSNGVTTLYSFMDTTQADDDTYYTYSTHSTDMQSDTTHTNNPAYIYRLLEVPAYTSTKFVSERYTLRLMNRQYASLERCVAVCDVPEEFAEYVTKDCVALLWMFDNTMGHFHDNTTLSYKSTVYFSFKETIVMAYMSMRESVRSGLL